MRGVLIIDDVLPALSAMTELGRAVLTAPLERLRQRVLEYAVARNWSVVKHAAFAEWVRELTGNAGLEWLSLDPLLQNYHNPRQLRPLRLSREFDGGASILRGPTVTGLGNIELVARELTGAVGVVDDVMASGRTLRTTVRLLNAAGVPVTDVMVCASSRGAREAFRQSHRALRWKEFLVGDWSVLHLRDGCPLLPYTGRPTVDRVVLDASGMGWELRVPVTHLLGHPWQVLCMNSEVREAATQTLLEGIAEFCQRLGRMATVADLRLLSDHVPVPRTSSAPVSGETTLASLFGVRVPAR